MAAIALAFAVETAVLTYLLVEFGEENGGELKIPDSVNMAELIEAANEIDVLSAPIDGHSHRRWWRRRWSPAKTRSKRRGRQDQKVPELDSSGPRTEGSLRSPDVH